MSLKEDTTTNLTEDELLLLSKEELEKKVQEAVPAVTGEAFTPDIMKPTENPIRVEVNHLKADWQRRSKTVFKTQAAALPAFIVLPAGLFFILPVDHATIPAFWFVGSIVLVLIYLWFTGRVSGWRKKTYETHAYTAEKESERIVLQRASEWARKRYVLPQGSIEWSAYGSEFRMGDRVFIWKEVEPVDGLDGYVIHEVETGQEPELKQQ